MWIEIRKDILETADLKGFKHLFHFLTYSPDHTVMRYHVIIDSRKVAHLQNYKDLANADKQLIDDEYTASVTLGARPKYHVTRHNNAGHTFNIEESIRFFSQPAAIILENNKNDAAFIEAIVKHFEEPSEDGFQIISEFIKNNWIAFENAGGCGNVMNYINGKMAGFKDLADRNNKTIYHYLRAVVILDSDREYPAQEPKPAYVHLESQLRQISISAYHILEKRSMENYMPDEAVQELSNPVTKKWIVCYNHLSDGQKDLLSYSKGFSNATDGKGTRLEIKQEIKDLYAIPITNFNILDAGIGLGKFKETFPKRFLDSGRVNKHTLKNRAGSDELEVILDKIRTLI